MILMQSNYVMIDVCFMFMIHKIALEIVFCFIIGYLFLNNKSSVRKSRKENDFVKFGA